MLKKYLADFLALFLVLFLALGSLFLWPNALSLAANEAPAIEGVRVVPSPLDRGTAGLVELAKGGADCAGEFTGRLIFFFEDQKENRAPGRDPGTRWVGLFGADITLKPGTYPLTVTCPGFKAQTLKVTVRDKSYGVRNIKVPAKQVDLSPEDQARAAQEKVLTDKALATVSPVRLWSGAFLEPVNGSVNSSFGRQTRLNGILNPRPHAGADFLTPIGTPVKAPAKGQVILEGDHFFSGKAIYIDHGQGLISMYFHLSEILVSSGAMVDKGQVIGKTGQTGRVTGPHLHYGVYLNGARIDPIPFRKLTTQF
ncbi:MAG: peptidoglycan DD-metalloendopeptidase family protein [Deltaproteobacteria bacterium]|jgi:murein DD-endopeptidase MepM/ murein hydrolase activator NlpD|nr:peptidoglycan DD-metalloendopeptidase family protein [Deltaproteobacteria bacterium]